jgi:hypothetical protein
MNKSAKKPVNKTRTPSWKTKGPGKWKTDLGGDQPEVIILELTNEDFQKNFSNEVAAKQYIDNLHILKRPLIKVVFADIVPAKDGNGWIVIGPHTAHSTLAIIAWQTSP